MWHTVCSLCSVFTVATLPARLSTDAGTSNDARVQGHGARLPADAHQVALRLQPARLLARHTRRAARAKHAHARDRQGQAGASVGARGLPRLLRQAHRRGRQVRAPTR